MTVFMLKSYVDEQSQQTAKSYGASGFINKPVDFSQLKQDIFNLVAEAL